MTESERAIGLPPGKGCKGGGGDCGAKKAHIFLRWGMFRHPGKFAPWCKPCFPFAHLGAQSFLKPEKKMTEGRGKREGEERNENREREKGEQRKENTEERGGMKE